MLKKFLKIKKKRVPISCLTVGIMGLAEGTGATHIGLTAAGFLSAYFGRQVLFAEAAGQKGLHYWLREEDKKQIVMRRGISYFLDADIDDLMQIKNMGYSCCIIDLGSCYPAIRDELMRCDIKIIIGTAALWQKDIWQAAADIVQEVKDCSSFYFVANFGDISDDIRKQLLPARIYSMPYEPDLSKISQETVILFRRIFKEFP